ncbi:MAG: acyltransferase, partial [Candidatus Bathyarchaeia archaeon]
MKFVSSRATVNGHLEDDVVMLGRSLVGAGSIIGRNVTIGYPSRRKIRSLISAKSFDIKRCDSVSEGAKIGEACTIRSGSVIYELAVLEDGVETGHNVLIRERSSVGKGSLVGSSTMLDGKVTIGRNVSIQSNVYLPRLTVIKDGVFIAPNVCFTNDPYPKSSRLAETIVEENAIISANSTILPGLRIGERAVVGAGSVVTRDVPAGW